MTSDTYIINGLGGDDTLRVSVGTVGNLSESFGVGTDTLIADFGSATSDVRVAAHYIGTLSIYPNFDGDVAEIVIATGGSGKVRSAAAVATTRSTADLDTA